MIEKTVKVSIRLEEQKRRKSSLAVAAYQTPEGVADSLITDLFITPKDALTKEVLTRLKKSGARIRTA